MSYNRRTFRRLEQSLTKLNKIFSQNTYTTVAGLVIVSPNYTNYNFTMTSSVAISISGQAIIPSPSTITVNSISAYVSSINFEVYYWLNKIKNIIKYEI